MSLSMPLTAAHLKHFRQGGFVETRRDGQRVLYRLAEGPILLLDASGRQRVLGRVVFPTKRHREVARLKPFDPVARVFQNRKI
ncbi:hypothetical protein ABCW43_21720 [Neorhizobium sp. IRAMC:178]